MMKSLQRPPGRPGSCHLLLGLARAPEQCGWCFSAPAVYQKHVDSVTHTSGGTPGIPDLTGNETRGLRLLACGYPASRW